MLGDGLDLQQRRATFEGCTELENIAPFDCSLQCQLKSLDSLTSVAKGFVASRLVAVAVAGVLSPADGTNLAAAVAVAVEVAAADACFAFAALDSMEAPALSREVSAKYKRRQLEDVDTSIRKHSSIRRGCKTPILDRIQRTDAPTSPRCQPENGFLGN